MKPYTTFINSSRGAVVRETEMTDVLQQRPDLVAVIDVTYPEPPSLDSPLFTLPNVILTPHIAGAMNTECRRLGQLMIDELERHLAGQPLRMGSATALTPRMILHVGTARMMKLLRKQHAMSDRFISHMLSRNIRIEEDLIDQLFNSSEKRLARALLLLARYGNKDAPVRVVPKVSQDTLAKMVGTTRSRVNFFLNKFKKLGFIEYDGLVPLKINSSLLSVVLHD